MRTIILFLLTLSNISMFAQQTISETDIDRISFEQFQHNQFKELKQTVKDANSKGIDFYYLRLRAGILAYNQKKYEYAIPQFKKALEFFPMDTLSKEYLYYSYLFTARKETAQDFASKQDKAFQKKVGYKKKPFDFIGIDGGAIITNNVSANRNVQFKDTINGKAERSLNGNLYFGEFFFQNNVKSRLHINNSFSVFNTNALYQIQVKPPAPFQVISAEQKFNNLNFQYNFGLSYVTKKEWEIGFGLGYYHVKGNLFSALRPDSITNTVPIARDTVSINSFLGSVTISKRCKYVKPYLQISASNLDTTIQVQVGAGLTYYPLGNYSFYGTTSASFLRNGSRNQYVIEQIIGFKILNWWWSEINFNYGNLSNFIANNGFVTYNTSDAIKLQTGINLNFYAKKHFQLNIGYVFQQRERAITAFRRDILNNSDIIETQKANYFTHIIKTSLLWNF